MSSRVVQRWVVIAVSGVVVLRIGSEKSIDEWYAVMVSNNMESEVKGSQVGSQPGISDDGVELCVAKLSLYHHEKSKSHQVLGTVARAICCVVLCWMGTRVRQSLLLDVMTDWEVVVVL